MTGCRHPGRQHAEHGPGLTAHFSSEPAHFASEERHGNHPGGEFEEPAVLRLLQLAADGEHGGVNEVGQHQQAHADHETEGPENHRDFGDGVLGGLGDVRVRCLGDILFRRVALREETVTQVFFVRLELRHGSGIVGVLAQQLERFHRRNAVLDALPRVRLDLVNTRHDLGEGVGQQRRQHIRHLDRPDVLLLALRRPGHHIERSRRSLGLPHGFHGGELGRLRMRADETQRVTQGDDPGSGQHAEQRGHAEGAASQFHMAVAHHIPGAHPGNEHRGGDVTGDAGMHELGLRVRAENQRAEVGEFHAHGHRVERGALRVLHEAVGHQNPQGRQVGADGHQIGHQQMLTFGQALPAEDHHADHGGFHEEGHQSFNGQRRTEDVADETGIKRPVGAELELHGQAGGHAQGEVDKKQLAPELGHVAVDRFAGGDVNRLHGGDHEADAQGEGDEKEVV